MSTAELDAKLFNASRGDACIRVNLHMQKKNEERVKEARFI